MSQEQPPSPPGVDLEAKTIRFDYIKGNYFRAIHVDGAFGGSSPRGDIRMSVWNERWPIPQQMVYRLGDEGGVTDELREKRIGRDAVIREVEVELVMDLEVAKNIRKWLDDKIKKAEDVRTIREGQAQ